MQGQYQPRAPGIAAGQSARATTATYFDYQGIMRTAQPGELRPNFVYQNGIWVQDGWLREVASANILSSFDVSDPTMLSGEYSERLLPDYPSYILEGGSSGSTFMLCYSPASKEINGVPSIFVKYISGNSVITMSQPWYYGPTFQWDVEAGVKIGDQTYPHISKTPFDWCRIWGNTVPEKSGATPAQRCQLNVPAGTTIAATLMQYEATQVADTATSWIPYGQTRDAD